MSTNESYLAGADAYNKEFDANQYLQDCYQLDKDADDKGNRTWMVKWLTLLHNVFSAGKTFYALILALSIPTPVCTLNVQYSQTPTSL